MLKTQNENETKRNKERERDVRLPEMLAERERSCAVEREGEGVARLYLRRR
jgi:hypothetical protein